MSEEARRCVDDAMKQCVAGGPRRIRETVEAVARRYETTEIFILTNCYSFEDRVRSYELVAGSLKYSL